jgi:MscS family membrane protein
MDFYLKIAIGTLGLAALFIVYWICKVTIHRKQSKSTKNVFWQVDLKKILLPPIKLLLVSLGCYYSLVFFGMHFSKICVTPWIQTLRDFIILTSCFWIVFRWKKELFHKKLKSLSMSEMLNKVISVALFVLFVLMSLGVFDVDIVPLLAFGGIGAAAVGFAAKDVLGNLFGGAMLSITRPFVKGDFVMLPEKNLEGFVEEIGWYLTCIRDRGKYPMYFPNSLFSSATVVNVSRLTHRRIFTALSFSYEDYSRITEITSAIREYLVQHEKIDKKVNLMVYWKQAGEYALDVEIDAYVFACTISEFVVLRESILLGIFKVIEDLGVTIPYPMSVVKLENE